MCAPRNGMREWEKMIKLLLSKLSLKLATSRMKGVA
jgi:hypothetical protein